jgi:hypothetical protein
MLADSPMYDSLLTAQWNVIYPRLTPIFYHTVVSCVSSLAGSTISKTRPTISRTATMLNTTIMTPTASKATTLSRTHYTYENTYTDENSLANFATREPVSPLKSDGEPAQVPRAYRVSGTCVSDVGFGGRNRRHPRSRLARYSKSTWADRRKYRTTFTSRLASWKTLIFNSTSEPYPNHR